MGYSTGCISKEDASTNRIPVPDPAALATVEICMLVGSKVRYHVVDLPVTQAGERIHESDGVFIKPTAKDTYEGV